MSIEVENCIAEEAPAPDAALLLLSILPRMDALNSWVRSRSPGTGSSIRRLIYHFKNEAIKGAQAASLATHRLIGVTVRCRDCGGSKRYIDQYGYTHDGCRACASSGAVHLQFIETTIERARLKWFSPVGSWRYETRHFGNWKEWPEQPAPEGWLPNQVGRDLSIDEVARHLMAIESFFPARPPVHRSYYDFCDFVVDDFAQYRLYIGRTADGRCVLCDSTADVPSWGYGCHLGRIEWSAIACTACRGVYGDNGIFDRLKLEVPPELLTDAVREWIAAHPAPPKEIR